MGHMAISPSILWVYLKELLSERSLPREPEPDLVMDTPENVAAFRDAGEPNGPLGGTYLFNALHISRTIQGRRHVVDLACGPARQLGIVAKLNPEISFTGVDLSDEMLEAAREHVRKEGLSNVSFQKGDVTKLDFLKTGSADGVMSTLALHHLPTFEHLRGCFQEVKRVLVPGGAVFLMDLARLKRLDSVLFFAYMHRNHQPHVFSLDFERSLRASFLPEDFKKLAEEELPADVRLFTSGKLSITMILKTPSQELDSRKKTALDGMIRALPARFRQNYGDLQFFHRLGGLS